MGFESSLASLPSKRFAIYVFQNKPSSSFRTVWRVTEGQHCKTGPCTSHLPRGVLCLYHGKNLVLDSAWKPDRKESTIRKEEKEEKSLYGCSFINHTATVSWKKRGVKSTRQASFFYLLSRLEGNCTRNVCVNYCFMTTWITTGLCKAFLAETPCI